MEKIPKSSSVNKPTVEGPFVVNGDKKFGENKTKFKKKEVNSWDCSTPTPNETKPKDNLSDWDSSSDCQETMVEPFEPKTSAKDYDDWDSESEKKNSSKAKIDKKELEELVVDTVSDSLDFSLADLSDKSSYADVSNLLSSKKNKNLCLSKNSLRSVGDLTIEDLEEFEKENSKSLSSKKEASLSSGIGKVKSKNSEGTVEDTTIWMIPKSERSMSADSTSKLISTSERMKIENLCNESSFVKKAKSFSSVQKNKLKKKPSRCTRSDIVGSFDFDKNNNNFYKSCEGLSLKKKLGMTSKIVKEEIAVCENFDRTKVFFTEYECRTMTVDEDKPSKMCSNSRDEELSENADADNEVSNNEVNRSSEHTVSEMVLAGPSAQPNLDVVSLPDMTGRKALKDKTTRRITSPGRKGGGAGPQTQPSTAANQIESWFFLDGTGQYQAVTRNEVSILLNGRSADTVLQGQKEHVIPSVNIKDPVFPQGSISGILTKESLQYFLREEDVGGEDGGKNQIDLERKMENTLLYIQPNMNLTASIRIIPVDTDMVHLWRRTRDTGSLISSEVDLRLHSPQDSIENNALRNPLIQSSFSRRIMPENHQQTVDEIDEVLSSDTLAGSAHETNRSARVPKNFVTDYNSLLLETRTIVDSLTKNFKIMQTRLDGETNRSLQLQGEVNKLRLLLKNNGEKNSQNKNSRENIANVNEHHLLQFDGSSSVSLIAVRELQEKKEPKAESINEDSFEDCREEPSDAFMNRKSSTIHISYPMEKDADKVFLNTNGFVTVNIYTMETQSSRECIVGSQETSSILQENLGIIERKMRRLQDENETIGRQNMELKKKLKEISQELEKYLGGTSEPELCAEEDEELDTLRDQVCNLKLELDNLKTTAWHKEEELSSEKSALLQKLSKHIKIQEDWCASASEIFLQIQKEKNRLAEIELELDLNTDVIVAKDPKTFQTNIIYYLQQVTELLFTLRNENHLYSETLKQSNQNIRENSQKDISGLNQVISGYTDLIEQCRKGSENVDSKVMEEYYSVMLEKASLTEEIKILKTENEMLLESQLEHYEKLKQTMIALKDRKTEILALESSQKIWEEEKNKMKETMKRHEDEKKKLENEILEKKEEIEKLKLEKSSFDTEIAETKEKLKVAANEVKNIEKSLLLKEELIKKLQMENDQLISAERIKNNQIEMMEKEMKQKTELESELLSTKLYLTESQKEMTEYVTHLESIINNSQDALEKNKQKLKESNQVIARLKSENEILDKQHGCDLKLYNTTKDELEICKKNLTTLSERLKELEEEKETLHKNFESVNRSEKEKSQALEMIEKQYKLIANENSCLKERIDIFSKDKDESIKEQKDLINKYGMLSKEVQKLQEKYRNVKTECNERTDLIKYLERMLKENILEYNSRIACLEKNISRILEKIAACKSSMKDKHFGNDSEVKELRLQLDVTCQERRELENVVENYYTLIKHLEGEIEEREKKMKELHEKVSLGQQKINECENAKVLAQSLKEVSDNKDYLRVEELEIQLTSTEKELLECKKNLQNTQITHESEKKKLEAIIADLNSDIKRYQLRIEVMMRNLSTSKMSMASSLFEKRILEDKSLQSVRRESEEKDRKIQHLNETLSQFKMEIEMKESDLERYKKRSLDLEEELKNVQNQFSKMQDMVSATNKNSEVQQKEREEMGEKLLQSIKLVMEERSTRQSLEMLVAEKEKGFSEQTEALKNALKQKEKEYETMSTSFEEKKKMINKLQDVVRKLKSEVASLKAQMGTKKSNSFCGSPPLKSTSLNSIDPQKSNYKERFESCIAELKEVRELNLQLRKTEGQYQAKIIQLEDDIRDARLLIKELEGDIKTEKKSKNALKKMISSAKMELEKCLMNKLLVSAVAERISRHLDLREIPSRELLSGFRISDNSNSSPLQILS